MARVKRGPGIDRELLRKCIKVIDQYLTQYFDGLPKEEVKLADYLKLAELKLLSARTGKKKVVVQWVNCDERDRQMKTEDEAG